MSARVSDFLPLNVPQAQEKSGQASVPVEKDEAISVQTCISSDIPVDQQSVSSCQLSPSEVQAARAGIQRNDVRAAIESKLSQAQSFGLTMPALPSITPVPLPTPEQVQNGLEQVGEAVRPVVEVVKKTAAGAVFAYLEDQLPLRETQDALDRPQMEDVVEQNLAGRAIGHSVALAQSTVEIIDGGAKIAAGLGEAGLTAPATTTGIGVLLPAAGLVIAGVGALEAGHGLAVGAHTINNVIHDPLLNADSNPTGGGGVDAPRGAGEWEFNPKVDSDWRNTGKTAKEAVDEAFNRTGVPREDFEVTKWAVDKNGKSFPVEWRSKGGAEVNIDVGHKLDGPAEPHVGYQKPGKRSAGGAVRGHIILDEVTINRPTTKD